MGLLHLLEPEETIGSLWHRLVDTQGAVCRFPEAACAFAEVEARLRVFFHGLGGGFGVALKPSRAEISGHRLNMRQRLGLRAERLPRARLDRECLLLPEKLDLLPERALNEKLYYWLAAFCAVASEVPRSTRPTNPLQADVARIGWNVDVSRAVLARFPGLAAHHRSLACALLDVRPSARHLPKAEAAVEAWILDVLRSTADGGVAPPGPAFEATAPPKGYRPPLPVPLWGEVSDQAHGVAAARQEEESSGSQQGAEDDTVRRAKQRQSERIEKKGGLVVHRFEKILTWTEFMNLHRDVEDDEEESARKAADDHDEIGVTQLKRRAATRLRFDLDLAPADAEAERISDKYVYPEWDYRLGQYQPAATRVLERLADETEGGWQPGPRTRQRIRAVRRQFEALRPKREVVPRQIDGSELDMDALIRSRADLAAAGDASDRIYRQTREQARDLSVAVLVDVSRSTESMVEERTVIDIEKEALVALAEGLAACGDSCAIYAFSSLRRDRVFMPRLKDFDEPPGFAVRARIAALKPAFYTRLGATIRHTSAMLAKRPSRRRLLLILTDGKPNDLDHYEGRYGVEDSRRAVLEARRMGHAVFGITVDSKAHGYFPHIFGTGAFAILSRPQKLTGALPLLYRHLTG